MPQTHHPQTQEVTAKWNTARNVRGSKWRKSEVKVTVQPVVPQPVEYCKQFLIKYCILDDIRWTFPDWVSGQQGMLILLDFLIEG